MVTSISANFSIHKGEEGGIKRVKEDLSDGYNL